MGASGSSPSPPRHERFGSFVLLAETERSWLATEYRAAHLGDRGLDRLVQLVRFEPASAPAAPDVLVEHVRAAAKAGPGILRPLGTGRVGAPWLSYEHHPGRSLRAVLERGREEAFPLSLDNALEIARQVCQTLEKVHARKLPSGAAQVHGFLAPWSVIVSFDGAVRLRGFGLWAGHALGALPPEEAGTLAPEQAQGRADARTDVYGLGALILECLRQAPLPAGTDVRTLIAETNGPEGDALPEALAATLARALSPQPDARHQGPAELRSELEALLFAGDVAPTTFNLAFFMETLYRGSVEAEARAIDEEMHADYLPYLRSAPAERPAAPVAEALAPEPVAAPPEPAPPVVPPPAPAPPTIAAARPAAPMVERSMPAATHDRPAAGERAGDKTPNRLPVVAAGVAAALLVGAGAFYFLKMRRPEAPSAPVATTLSAEAQAALIRVQELEARLKALEAERVQAEAAAAEQASQRLQAEAKARGQAVDQRAIERAKEEAARKVRAQEEKRQQEERQRLERQKRDEEARLAAAAPPTTLPAAPSPEPTPTAVAVAAAEAPPTMAAAVEPSPSPPADAGAPAGPIVYDFNAPGVVPPALVSQRQLEYPLVARTARITGSVTVSAVVNEEGRVENARATSGNPVLRKAAVDHVSGRRYRPAQKDGVPVRIQMVIQVNFKG